MTVSGAPVSVKVSEKLGNYFFIGQNIPQKCKGFEKENRSIDDLQKKAGLKANGNCFHHRTHFLGLRTAVSGLRKVTITHNFLVLSGTHYLVLPLTCTTG